MLTDKKNLKALMRAPAVPLIGEGLAMLLCVPAAWHFADGTAGTMAACALFTLLTGLLLQVSIPKLKQQPDTQASYLIVALIWLLLTLFATLPFLATGSLQHLAPAFFEAMSGLTSTGATVVSDVESLPASILLWRSVMQWIGGYGIVVLVLAVVPSLGINKYSLYTAEASGADNTGKATTSMAATIRQTLMVYVALTLFFIVLLMAMRMQPWDAVNLVFCNISTGGFSPYGDSIARFPAAQQYVLAATMLFGGINFMLLYNLFTLRLEGLRGKTDQLRAYLGVILLAVAVVASALRWKMQYAWPDAIRLATVQSISAATTTGSLAADTGQWWPPILFLYLVLALCGGMAGSTSGGLKTMRVLILLRNVRTMLRGRLHPHAVNPVRLNGKPVPEQLISNIIVIFLIFILTSVVCAGLLILCGVGALEAIGATVACITSYGSGLGACGGMGNFAIMPVAAQWILSVVMLLGRLEFMTILILFLPDFWRK